MMQEKCRAIAWVNEHERECVALLQNLVRIPSENRPPEGDELESQEFIEQQWRQLGLKTKMFEPDSLPGIEDHCGFLVGRNYHNRPNVAGVLSAESSSKRIMLTAHMDVVRTGDHELWTNNDPWSGRVENGFLFGRGSADDKSGVAAITMATRALIECGIQLKKELVLTSVVDEESGGANGALAAVLEYPCDYYLNVDGIHDVYSPVSLSGGRFRIDFYTTGVNPCARNVLDAMMICYEELRAIEGLKKKEFESTPIFSELLDELDVFRVMEFFAGNEEDLLESSHGVIKAYIYSTENIVANKKQIEGIIDCAYARMDKTKVKRPELSFYRRYFTGAKTDVSEPLVQFCVQNHKLVTGSEPKLATALISDQAVIAEYGKGVTIGLGASPHTNEPNTFHQADEAVKLEDYFNLIKVIALTIIDLDRCV